MNVLGQIEAAQRQGDAGTALLVLGEQALARLLRSESAVSEMAPGRSSYWAGPVICIGTSRRAHSAGDDTGTALIGMIAAAIRDSRMSSLIQAVVRHSSDGDRIVCAFEGGREVPLDDARQVALKGYAATVGKVLQGR